jgi:hypothetical protein
MVAISLTGVPFNSQPNEKLLWENIYAVNLLMRVESSRKGTGKLFY